MKNFVDIYISGSDIKISGARVMINIKIKELSVKNRILLCAAMLGDILHHSLDVQVVHPARGHNNYDPLRLVIDHLTFGLPLTIMSFIERKQV